MYGLEHAVLNQTLPPPTMWMNMGYWKTQIEDPRDFPAACKALLEQVVNAAFPPDSDNPAVRPDIRLLDIGFGCGDQTLLLLGHGERKQDLPNVVKYVGITKAEKQYLWACESILDSKQKDVVPVKLFCEDAGNPEQWSSGLSDAVVELLQNESESKQPEMWLLGLDSMLHLRPSRTPLLRFACNNLHASYMAFDLMRADGNETPSLFQRFLLRFICTATSTPHKNLMTATQYREMLISAGYAPEDIEIRDISKYVFQPLAQFMERKDDQLRTFGQGLGPLRIAKWVFGWWGRSGVIRGCIITARNKVHGR